jgi:long-chain acyl-CoA synthetase
LDFRTKPIIFTPKRFAMALVIEKFLQFEKERAEKLFLHQPMGGHANTWTWKEAGHQARILAQALHNMGLKKGDKVALLSKNCAEWIIADLAIMMGGFVSVPLYANITAPTIRMILEHSGSKAIFIGKLDDFQSQAAGLTPDVPAIYMGVYGHKGSLMWEDLLKKHAPIAEVHIPEREELITIMYTSGTTGRPKGVMHTAGNFEDTITAAGAIGIKPYPKMFSFLPLSHIAERTGIEMLGISYGCTFHFAHSLESFGTDLAAVQPDVFFAVPRIWAKFREKVGEKLPEAKLNKLIKIPLLGGFIKKKIRKGMGLNNATRIISGAAPISVEMMEWYRKIGIEILQAYGMTEDCVYCHFNLPGANKLGTIGRPLPGLEVRISEEGEIQVKNSALMKGYFREPELTAEMFTEDGFLHTGDKGFRDAEGFLTITGRLKDQFKTDKGKYISPSSIELRLTDSSLVEQACVVGMGIPQPIGLVVLAETEKGKDRTTLSQELEEMMKNLNRQLEAHEKMEKLVVLPEPWTVENGLMTPTLKVKRNEVEKIHQDTYSDWFHHREKIIWL